MMRMELKRKREVGNNSTTTRSILAEKGIQPLILRKRVHISIFPVLKLLQEIKGTMLKM